VANDSDSITIVKTKRNAIESAHDHRLAVLSEFAPNAVEKVELERSRARVVDRKVNRDIG